MPQQGRKGRLDPAVGTARRALAQVLQEHLPGAGIAPTGRGNRGGDVARSAAPQTPLVLVACSGGPDSLALAAVAAHFRRRGDVRVGAVVVDHGLQENSAETAAEAAEACLGLGLDPVLVRGAAPPAAGHGPEMAARLARYEVFEQVAEEHRPAAVLVGHTRGDQAESVLLGLARGSGTKSLAGMPVSRPLGPTLLLRPFLDLDREQIEQVCAAEGLRPWHDPTNQDPSFLRNRVRHEVLPFLEKTLGPGLEKALARTAAVLGEDAAHLDEEAERALEDARTDPSGFQPPRATRPAARAEGSVHRVPGTGAAPGRPVLALAQEVLRPLAPALRRRVLARAVLEAGGEAPSFERLAALDELATGHGSAGPVQVPGRVAVWRRRPAAGDRSARGTGPGALVLARD